MKAMKELQDAGKIRFIGISECSAETLERALEVARVDAVQVEYSPWETSPERSGLLDVMRKNQISLVGAQRPHDAAEDGILTWHVGRLLSPG